MGCLNSNKAKGWHTFGNIHLSGPCNRKCYFCIGQHMMALDQYNALDKWPLDGLPEFARACNARGVREVNITGTNTEPLLYRHLKPLKEWLAGNIPNLILGVRSNGALALERAEDWKLFDKGSVSFPTFDVDLYERSMGSREVPDIEGIVRATPWPVKVNICLSPWLVDTGDLFVTIQRLARAGVRQINVRELYGQTHVGDPMEGKLERIGSRFGMPLYKDGTVRVLYWDVHYVEVESVNLYMNGNVSETYPVTKGHIPNDGGDVRDQGQFGKEHKRHVEQWRKVLA